MKKIQILGTGCPKCKKLAENVETAAKALNVDFIIEKVTDINAILSFGVVIPPALVIDGEVKVAGRVPPVEEIKKMFPG